MMFSKVVTNGEAYLAIFEDGKLQDRYAYCEVMK